jgi:hypothetical protein
MLEPARNFRHAITTQPFLDQPQHQVEDRARPAEAVILRPSRRIVTSRAAIPGKSALKAAS